MKKTIDNTAIQKLQGLAPQQGWAENRSPLIRPLAGGQGMLRRAAGLFGSGSGVSATNLFLTLAHRPILFFSWLIFSACLMPYGKLQRRHKELIILRCAWLSRSRYEWNQHVVIGLTAGLEEDEIYRLTEPLCEQGWDEQCYLLLTACEEFFSNREVSEATVVQLGAYFNEKELLDIVLLMAQYLALAGVIQSLGVRVEG